MDGEIRGYKVFNHDWTCRGFQYEVGKIFEEDAVPSCCNRGFHFCLKASDCFNYYRFDPGNKVAEVVALGAVDFSNNDSKACTNKLQIMREIPWQELLTIVNTGKACTGLCNTGNYNTGDCNTGDHNTGSYNTGDCNTGNHNTGDWNTGNRNTGEWNSSSFNTGCFNTKEQKIVMFDKPSNLTYGQWLSSYARSLLHRIPKNVVEWVDSHSMTDEERAAFPEYETTGGYLKVLEGEECAQLWWDGLDEQHRGIIFSIPNFDPDIFKLCTGIDVNAGQQDTMDAGKSGLDGTV